MGTKLSLKPSSRKACYWRKHVDGWSVSGLSQAEYCRRSGISLSTFQYRKRRLSRQAGVNEQSIVAVPIPVNSQPAPLDQKPLMLHVGSVFRVEVGGDFNPVVLKKLIVTLEGLS